MLINRGQTLLVTIIEEGEKGRGAELWRRMIRDIVTDSRRLLDEVEVQRQLTKGGQKMSHLQFCSVNFFPNTQSMRHW